MPAEAASWNPVFRRTRAGKGPLKVKDNGKVQLKVDVDADLKVQLSAKCSADGKLYDKICTQGKF